MNGKRNATLFTAAFFLLAFVLLGCTLGMQFSLRATLDALPESQNSEAKVTVTETLAPTAVSDESPLPLTESETTAPVDSVQQTEPTTQRNRAVRTATTRRQTTTTEKSTQLSEVLVVNTNSKKIHSPDCSYVKNMKEENRLEISAEQLEEYLNDGYSMCAHCKGYVQ